MSAERDVLVDLVADLDEGAALARVRERIGAGDPPSRVLADCRAGLARVGELYEKGEYYISGLVMAGEIFREALELLEPLIGGPAPETGVPAGSVLICTVQGDIHDLGKSLVRTLLQSNGFTVHDLGVDVAPDEVARAYLDLRPDVVALSAMLVTSFAGMRETVAAVRAAAAAIGADVPILVGGARVDAETSAWVGADRWSDDAGEAVRIIRELVAESRRGG